jgi:hypothetical protein
MHDVLARSFACTLSLALSRTESLEQEGGGGGRLEER